MSWRQFCYWELANQDQDDDTDGDDDNDEDGNEDDDDEYGDDYYNYDDEGDKATEALFELISFLVRIDEENLKSREPNL
jgi:hypothetical protein